MTPPFAIADFNAPALVSVPAARPVRFSGSLVALCFALASAGILLILPRGALAQLGAEQVVWLTALLTFGLTFYLMRQYRRIALNPWGSAVTLTLAYYAFRYGWGALVVYYWEFLPWEAIPALRLRFYHQGGRMAVEDICDLVMLGALGLFVGALLPTRRIAAWLPQLKWPVDDRKLRRNIILYMPVGLFLLLYLAAVVHPAAQFVVELSGRFVYLSNIFCGYWLFSARSSGERTKWLLILIATTGLSMTLGLIHGMVGECLAPLVFCIFGYMLARARLPWKLLVVVIPLMFFLVLPFLTIYKEIALEHKQSGIPERLDYAWEKFDSLDYRRGLELAIDRVVARMAESGYPTIFARYYPAVYPHENGRTLWLEVATLMPRFVWPDKPGVSTELNRYSSGVGIVREGDSTSAVFDAVSEYYVNFGAPGVFFLSVIHGLYISVLTAWLMRNVKQPMASGLSMALFFTNPEFFGVGVALNAQIKIIPVWLLYLYAFSRRMFARRGA
jgi:hypothetical protein